MCNEQDPRLLQVRRKHEEAEQERKVQIGEAQRALAEAKARGSTVAGEAGGGSGRQVTAAALLPASEDFGLVLVGPAAAPPVQLIGEGGPRQIDHSQLLTDLVASAPQSAGTMDAVAKAQAVGACRNPLPLWFPGVFLREIAAADTTGRVLRRGAGGGNGVR